MSSTKNVLDQIKKAAKAIHQAEALLFTAGAGMGVDRFNILCFVQLTQVKWFT